MSFDSWLQNLRSALAPGRGQRHHRRHGALRAATHRPSLEALDDRLTPSFSPAISFPVGTTPDAVAAADFNNDGRLDLATANFGDNTVCVLLGNANGTFQPAQTSAAGSYPHSLAVGDFNADGQLDLATANDDIYDISILPGNGDGTFAAGLPQSIGSDSYPVAVATGDLNADGKLDLVVTSEDDWLVAQYVSVLLGHGDGSFAPAANYGPYSGFPGSPALADVNSDGNADVVVTADTGLVRVLLGNGDGTLHEPSHFGISLNAYSVAVGDFNTDRKLDLATENVDVLLGNGDGTFQAAQSFAAGGNSVTAGDVNGDGVLDLVVADPGGVSVLLGHGDGSFASPITTAAGSSPHSVVVADFNGDGRPDVAAANGGSNTVSMLLNDGDWTPPPPPPTLGIYDETATEGNTGTIAATFTVTLSAASTKTVTVDFALADGSATLADNDYGYADANRTLTFAPGQTQQTIAVVIQADLTTEPDETFLVNLINPTNATIADGQAVGTIRNDDLETRFYVVDASSDRTFEYAAAGQPVENYGLRSGNNDPRGAASDASGQRVWVIDNDDYVYVYDAAGNSLGAWKARGLSTPEGIASNGTDLWIVDRGKDRVYRFAGAASRTSGSASPTSSFALNSGNGDATGIETDGTHLWVVNDASTDKVFKYTLSGALVGSWTISGNNTTPTGITLDPSNPSDVWIVDAGRDQVFQYSAAAGRTSGSQSANAVFNLAPGNSNPQGIADPPPPVPARAADKDDGKAREEKATEQAEAGVPIGRRATWIWPMPGRAEVNDWAAILDVLVSESLRKRRR